MGLKRRFEKEVFSMVERTLFLFILCMFIRKVLVL